MELPLWNSLALLQKENAKILADYASLDKSQKRLLAASWRPSGTMPGGHFHLEDAMDTLATPEIIGYLDGKGCYTNGLYQVAIKRD